ncbi:hypothetical protein [Flavobacterium ginsenosidimutans]|uniref:hypothetical protein n=1 Tax=Flavobacterium ginsenosidimutans TaxID=687844 RepID=UPI003D96F98B
MKTHFKDLAITIRAQNLEVPYNLVDECLFLTIRADLLELLCNEKTEIFCIGAAPDNTADGLDELLENGVFYRIIAYRKNLGIDLESPAEVILSSFHYLVQNFEPRWATIFAEEGSDKKEVTIELLYQNIF